MFNDIMCFMPKDHPISDLVSESDMMNRFEFARTWNRYYLLYILKDGIPRSRVDLVTEFRRRKAYTLRQTVYGIIDALLKDELIFETNDGLFCINQRLGETYTVGELKILRYLDAEWAEWGEGRAPNTISTECEMLDGEVKAGLDRLVSLNKVKFIDSPTLPGKQVAIIVKD